MSVVQSNNCYYLSLEFLHLFNIHHISFLHWDPKEQFKLLVAGLTSVLRNRFNLLKKTILKVPHLGKCSSSYQLQLI